MRAHYLLLHGSRGQYTTDFAAADKNLKATHLLNWLGLAGETNLQSGPSVVDHDNMGR